MDNDLIIKLLDKQETSIKNYIDISNARAEGQLDRVIEHQERQNHRLEKHDEAIIKLAEADVLLEKQDILFTNYQINCPANRLAAKLSKRRFWVGAVAITIVAYITLATIWHTVGFGDIFLKLVNLI